MNIRTYRLGDILKRKTNKITIEDDQHYKLVTIKLHHKGVVLREKKYGSEISSSKMTEVKEGDFILSGIDARNGAFGIVPEELKGAVITNDFWCLDVNEDLVDKAFFLYLTNTPFFDFICNQASDGTTQRIRLQKHKFFNYEIDLPEKKDQAIFYEKLLRADSISTKLNRELIHQQTLLKQLRQAILQEAVQGKLTEQWRKDNPKVEPASVLLEKIKAEKARLIQEKKIRKGKPLPPISQDEVPFALPEGWVWCRLGEVALKITDGTHHSPPNREKGAFKYVTAKNIKEEGIDLSKITYVSEDVHRAISSRCDPEFGDVLLIKDGATTGIVTINNLKEGFSMLSSVALIKCSIYLLNKYLIYAMRSGYYYDATRKDMYGVAITRVTLAKIINSFIPLPPLSEQKAIVEKVESLLVKVSQLEEEVQQNQQRAEQLLQSVLREVMQPKKEVIL